jgi:hypothetical protein
MYYIDSEFAKSCKLRKFKSFQQISRKDLLMVRTPSPRPTTTSRQWDLWWVPWIIIAALFLVVASLWSNYSRMVGAPQAPVSPTTVTVSMPVPAATTLLPSKECADVSGGINCVISLEGKKVRLVGRRLDQWTNYSCQAWDQKSVVCDREGWSSTDQSPDRIWLIRGNGSAGKVTSIGVNIPK